MSYGAAEHLTVLLKDGLGGRRQTRVPVPIADLASLMEAVRQAFQPELDTQEFFLTSSSSRVIDSDAAARKLRPGDQLRVCAGTPGSAMATGSLAPGTVGRSKPPLGGPKHGSSLFGASLAGRKSLAPGSGYKPPAKERISFVPHPKTLTMAGDYEYFAARGHHPFAFALAELVDNSLRATKGQQRLVVPATIDGGAVVGSGDGATVVGAAALESGSGPQSRDITISLVVNERGTAGLIRVQDNGRGMTPKELGEWAVMNLSMEDRGLLPSGTERALELAGGGRYLSGDLSFFGVGSKTAAFFMGSSVKLATRQAGSGSVHELHIAGAELERRYRSGENVYEEDMVHREPGDDSTLSQQESAFSMTRTWLAAEPAATSFTRVTIAELRPEVLSLVRDSESCAMVCRDLAHLYHYYLHGPAGNVGAAAASDGAGGRGSGAGASGGGAAAGGILPGGEAMPNIVIEHLVGSRLAWRRQLAEVDDDLESRYVRGAKSKIEFELEVPGRGTVEGVLWYFPFENGAESVPRELGAAAYASGGPAAGGPGLLTQMPTQLSMHGAAALATQLVRGGLAAAGVSATQVGQWPEQAQLAMMEMLHDQDNNGGDAPARGRVDAPMFETFWQGRLIPGSGVESLPFIDGLRTKMRSSTSGKDYLPDDVFGRIRGALFFGPAWRVTRNKLTFRDSLPELLASAMSSDRALDKRFRDWLRDCHTRLDRILHFQGAADVELKATVRKELGESFSGFTRVADGARSFSVGDVVRLATKPVSLGRIKYFAVQQAGAAEGVYATGFVTITGLPAFLHGPRHTSTLPIRRVEEVVSPAALEEYTARERAKLPSSLRLEPLRLASGRRVDVAVGEALPETTVSLHNAAGQRMTRAFLLGQKVALRVQQRLVYLGPRRPSAYCSGAAALAAGDEELAAQAEAGAGPDDLTVAAAAVNPDGPSAAAAPPPPPLPEAEAEAADAAGKRGRKRRKKNGPIAEADAGTGKENQVPSAPQQQQPGGVKRARRGSAAGSGASAAVAEGGAAAAPVSSAAAAGPLAEGVGEVVLVVENKTPVDNTYQFSRITGGLNRAGTYFLEYRLLPDLPAGCDPAGGSGPVVVWSRTVLYAAAGPPVRFELRGEARAVLATKSLALGEVLPPLQLVCYDAQDNPVAPPAATAASGPPAVLVEVMRPGSDTSGRVDEPGSSQALEELQLEWQTAPSTEAMVLDGLRITGRRCDGGGMRLFGGDGSARGQPGSLEHTPAGGQVVPASLEQTAPDVPLQLRISLPDMPSQVLSLKLRPGAPAALRLLPGHPFPTAADGGNAASAAAGRSLEPVCVMNGETLPDFQVLVLDAWGNATSPSADLPASLELEGPLLQSSPAPFDIDARGRASIRGVRVAAPDSTCIGIPQDFVLSIRCTARGAGPRAALQAAEQAIAEAEAAAAMGASWAAGGGLLGWSRLLLPVLVQPCTLPAALAVLYRGEPCEVGPSASGEGMAAVLRDIPAGSRLSELSLALLDEGGRPAEPGFKGRLQISWAKGSKKVNVTEAGAMLDLPALPVREQAGGEPQSVWVRFVGDGALLSGTTLEIALEVHVVPGPPAAWGCSILESGAAAGGGPSQATEALGRVACGDPICLEIEAHDAYNNKCSGWTGAGPRPTPTVVPSREQRDAPLLYDTADWVCGWQVSQHTGNEFYQVQMVLGGSAGDVKLLVRDTQGPGGESLLSPDELPVVLLPGRPTTLAFDGPQQLQCGSRASLGDLRVRVTDDWGNPVEALGAGGCGGGRSSKEAGSGLEVSLQSSAIAVDGSGNAAKVVVAGSNKAKVSKGCACFRDVRVDGAPGAYALRVGSASRKVALREAVLMVEMFSQNVVRHVAVAPYSLPQEPLEPGVPLEIQVEVTTEDGKPLPYDIAAAGLALRLKTPSAEAAAAARGDAGAAVGAAAGGGGSAGNSAAACTVLLQPQPPDEGASPSSRSLWTFVTPGSLVVAGEYTITAEYVELRPELTRELSKSEHHVRSVSHAVQLLPGPPVRATLESDGRSSAAAAAGSEGAGPLLVTNGSDSRGRTLMSSAAVQLRDAYGNPVGLDGVCVRWVLGWPAAEVEVEGYGEAADGGGARMVAGEEPGPAPEAAVAAGAELPSLQGAREDVPYAVEALTDSRGRAFFRELAVAEGSGRVGQQPRDGCADAPQALHLELRLQAALHPGGGPSAGGAGGWLCCWCVPVMFSDNAARAANLQRLCARREELAAAVAREEAAKDEADRARDAAQQAARQAEAEVERIARRAAASTKPRSSTEARELAQHLREQQQRALSASQQRRDTRAARFGASTSGVVVALNRCLAAPEGQGEVVGVMAQLATVDNPHLSALLSAAYSSTLQILVVRSYECIKRLRDMLTATRSPIPSMLATSMIQAFTGDGGRQAAEMVAAMRNVSPEARELQAAACDGADPPLPMLLPHTRMLMAVSQDRAQAVAGAGPAVNEWPHGCLGYAVNLVRPVGHGHRATIFYSQLGRTLVFETLDQAAAYRTYVVQTLGCGGLGDIYTLDGGKLSGRGVVVGSGFRVVPVEDAVVRFGAAQGSQAAQAKQLTQQVADMEELAAAWEAVERAAGEEAEAEAAAEAAGQGAEAVRAEVGEELAAVEAEIARLAGEQPGGAGQGGGGSRRQKGGRGRKRSRDAAQPTQLPQTAGEEAAPHEPPPDPDQQDTRGGAGEGGGRGHRSKRNKGRMAAMQ